MATVVQPFIEPNPDAIKAHLVALFAACAEHYPQGLIELRYGQDAPNQWSYFNSRPDGIEEAAAFAANRNREGCNVYVGANPRKPTTSGAASDTDIAIAFFHFADLDDVEAVEQAGRRMKALPPTFTVTTGMEPHRRPHLYWQLDEPVGNMAAWTERQRGIAQSFDGDSVINPSRIMRLAGTVNYPPQHKIARGYRMELTSIRTEFSDERAPVTPEQIATAYPVRTISNMETVAQGQNTLQAMRRTRVGDLIDACVRGDQWHNSMVRLTGHLAATGRTTAEIMAMADHITLPGYTVEQTRNEMAKALDGARLKWALPEPEDDVIETEEAARDASLETFPLLDLDEIDAIPPPSWLIHEMVSEHGMTVIYGDPGAGKSFIALDMALRIATGMDWHGSSTKQTGVLYIAGEGAVGLAKRIRGWKHEHAMDGIDAPFLLLPVAVQLLDKDMRAKLLRTISAAVDRAQFPIGLIIIDTVSRALAGADENGQEAMGTFVNACDEIKQFAGGAVMGVHHSGKDKDKGMRGSTVLLGGCDASIRVSKDEQTVTLKTEKQKDAEEAEPIYMAMRKVTWAKGLEEEQSTLVPFRSEASANQETDNLSRDQIGRAFGMLADRWGEGRPMSNAPQTKRDGRYAPSIFAREIGGTAEMWADYIIQWLENGALSIIELNGHSRIKGLKVEEPVL